ncbi:MAG: response regulator [Gammaproteobacteria bacterium]|nr:response regulator [Gammaproteobacteria bacterium]
MFRTNNLKIRTCYGVVFFLILWSFNAYSVEPSWVGKTKFNGDSSGVVRAIIAQDNHLYLGAENGFLDLVGETSTFYSPENSVLSDGYISDLTLDNEGNIWISQFGSGLFIFRPNDRSLSTSPLPPELTKSSWAVAVAEQFLGISLINQILIHNTETGLNTIIDKNHQSGRLRRIYGAEYLPDIGFVFPEASGLVVHEPVLKKTSFYSIEKYFPMLNSVTSVSVYEGHLLVGGPGGVYKWDFASTAIYYPFEDTRYSLNDVDQIFVSSAGQIWIAATGLYYLDKEKNIISELKQGQPKYSIEQIKTIGAIAELENEAIIVGSSQLGLLTINANDTGIKYLHKTDFPYRKDIEWLKSVTNSSALVGSSDHQFKLDLISGKLVESPLSDFKTVPIAITDGSVFSTDDCVLMKSDGVDLEVVTAVKDPDNFCGKLKPIVFQNGGNSYIYYEVESHAGFAQLSMNELKHYMNAPKGIRFISTERNNALVVLDQKNRLYSMEEIGVWIKHEAVNMQRFFVYCMYSHPTDDIIYLCTSGGGLKQYDLSSRQFKGAFTGLNLPRFIRDGFIDGEGHHWLATNKGLFFTNGESAYQFDRSDGVIDTDFNHQGLMPITDSKFVLVGDQMSYLVDTGKLAAYVQGRRKYESVASVFSLQLINDDKKIMSDPKSLLSETLASAPDEMIFEFASADYVYPHLHKLEYRLKGFHEEWQELPANMGTVAYSGLSFGAFDFQVRVVDSKSQAVQPISRYPFTIARPMWLTWQAYLLYLVALALTIWLVVVLIKRHMAEKSRVLAAVIEQKQSALLESNQSITELLNKKEKIFSNLANEIKTPLMQILNPLTELRARPLTADIRGKLDVVYDNAGRLRVLTDQLAAVERIEHISGQVLQRYNIANTLDFLVETWRPEALKKQLILSCDCDIKTPVLLIQDSLEALLNHLLVNAISYTQPGGQVRIKAIHHADKLIVCIKDNGPGMAKQQLEFVTSRFAMGSNYNGSNNTGIGLNLANALALANDGWLELKSEPGLGTEVSVHLPFNPALTVEALTVDDGTQRQVAEQSAQYRESNLPVVLVIERSHEACEYIINLLGENFNCYSTQSGMQALEIIPVLQPDVIVTELNITDISGVVFTSKLREQDAFADLPVMILTAASDHSSKLNSFKASVNDYLVKPVEREELISRIESNLTYSRLAHRHNVSRSANDDAENTPAYVKAILPRCDNEKDRKFIVKFLDVIERNYQDERFNRSRASALLAMSDRQLNRTLSKLLPDNFTMFLKKYRLEKSMPMLEQGLQITQIAFEVGFGSGAYYSRCFKQVYKVLPSDYQFPDK